MVGKPKGKHTLAVVSYLFEKDKGWTLEKAKEWFEKHHTPTKDHASAVLPFAIAEKMLKKPLRMWVIAMIAVMSRNFTEINAGRLRKNLQPEALAAFRAGTSLLSNSNAYIKFGWLLRKETFCLEH